MPSTVAPDDVLLQDPVLQKRIADLAKFGILWTPPSQRPAPPQEEQEPDPAAPTAPTSSTPAKKGPKHPRKKAAVPDIPSEPESESEMMGPAYQDALAAANNKRSPHLAHGFGASRSEAAKLDAEAFADLGLKMGEADHRLLDFVPWRFLVRYAVST